MRFEYLIKVQKESSIDIENIGNCALNCFNDLGFEWILIIKTHEGQTEIIEYGPLIADLEYLPANVSYTYTRFDFSESKIHKRISAFLTDGYRNVTQAFELTHEEALDKIRDMRKYLYVDK